MLKHIKLKTRSLFLILIVIIFSVRIINTILYEFDSKDRFNSRIKTNDYSYVGVVQSKRSEAKQLTEMDIQDMVNRAIENSGGLQGITKPGGTALIKVNLVETKLYSSYNGNASTKGPTIFLDKEVNGVTVDFRVARALVKKLLSAGFKEVYIIEGSLQPTLSVYKYMGYDTITEIPQKNLIALENDIQTNNKIDYSKLKRITIKDGLITRVYYINKRILEVDAIISLAVLKTHRRIALSGTAKNIGIGLYPALIKPNKLLNQFFPNDRGDIIDHRPVPLSKWIADYYSLIPAKFALIDGLQASQNGPLSYNKEDRQMNMRTIIAASDGIAVDTVASLIMGRDPESALYLKMLEKRGVGIASPSNIIVIGDKVSDIRKNFKSLYGNPIPQERNLKINLKSKFKIQNKTEVSFEIESSHKIARIELVVDGKIEKMYDKNTRKIAIDKSLYNKQLLIKVYNIFLDEAKEKVVITND